MARRRLWLPPLARAASSTNRAPSLAESWRNLARRYQFVESLERGAELTYP